ncbi:MAG: hypothetical protein DRP64_00060 [Verrucomicrobia bacterium]|nr:MAG: hypothetical protein DRP64_00060 [Verrucomicrobiota bacterium]
MGATTVDINIWADELMTSVSGCTSAGAKQALKATLREFNVQSAAWVRELRPISIKANKADYFLDPQPDSAILYILAIDYLQPNPNDSSDANQNGRFTRRLVPMQVPTIRNRQRTPAAEPAWYAGDAEVPGKFTLLPTVDRDIDDCMYCYVALTMKEPWDGRVPYTYERYHFDKILDGATGRLFSQPGKPYTNPKMAQYHLRRFRNGMAQARDMAQRQFNKSGNDFIYPRWAV